MIDETEVSHGEDERVRAMAVRWLAEYEARKAVPHGDDTTEAFLIRALLYRWNEASS